MKANEILTDGTEYAWRRSAYGQVRRVRVPEFATMHRTFDIIEKELA